MAGCGVDNDFVVKEGAQWIIRRLLRRLRGRWRRLVCGYGETVLFAEGSLPDTFPDFALVSRDLEMQKWSDREGAATDENGEGSLSLHLFPLLDGEVDIDLVLPEPRPHAFTEFVLGCLASAIFDWYRWRSLPVLREKGWLVPGQYLAEVSATPDWMEQAVLVCCEKRWPGRGSNEGSPDDDGAAGMDTRWDLRVTVQEPHADGEDRTAIFFCGASMMGRSGSFVGVRFPKVVSREWRNQVRAVLSEAVAMWHVVSWRSMQNPRVIFTGPPGAPVLDEGVVRFEGPGGPYPELKKKELPVEVLRKPRSRIS